MLDIKIIRRLIFPGVVFLALHLVWRPSEAAYAHTGINCIKEALEDCERTKCGCTDKLTLCLKDPSFIGENITESENKIKKQASDLVVECKQCLQGESTDEELCFAAIDEGKKSAIKIIIASGPGGTAFNSKGVETLKDNYGKLVGKDAVASVGNGEGPLPMNQMLQEIRKAKEQNQKILLFVQAHGVNKNGEHYIEVEEDVYLKSSEFFKQIAKESGPKHPIDIFMTSCHGNAALPDGREHLPAGSTLVTLAPWNECSVDSDVQNLREGIGKLCLKNEKQAADGKYLMYVYLTQALKNRIAPGYIVSGGEDSTMNANVDLKARIGNRFSEREKEKIHNRLDDLMGKDEVNKMIGKIEAAKNEFNINAVEYGPALAVVMAANEREK